MIQESLDRTSTARGARSRGGPAYKEFGFMICGTLMRASVPVAGLDCPLSAVCSVTPRQLRRRAMLTWITIHCGAPLRPLAEGSRRRWKAGARWSHFGVAPSCEAAAPHLRFMSAFLPKADMCGAITNVRFGP